VDVFKICPCCGKKWQSRAEFLRDPDLTIEGYQANFVELEAGIFLFCHNVNECRTSLAIEAGAFVDLYRGPIFADRFANTDQCSGCCVHSSNLDPCRKQCECAYVREVLQIVKRWPKQIAGKDK
jgi:hypothetical protein